MKLKKNLLTIAALAIFAALFWACAPAKPAKPYTAPVIEKKSNE